MNAAMCKPTSIVRTWSKAWAWLFQIWENGRNSFAVFEADTVASGRIVQTKFEIWEFLLLHIIEHGSRNCEEIDDEKEEEVAKHEKKE